MDWTALLTPQTIAGVLALLLAIVGIPTTIVRLMMKRSDERILKLENEAIEKRGDQTFNQKVFDSFNGYIDKSYEMSQKFVDAINDGNEKTDQLIKAAEAQTAELRNLPEAYEKSADKIIAEIHTGNQQAKQRSDILEGKLDTMIQQFAKVSRGLDVTTDLSRAAKKTAETNQVLLNKLIAALEPIAPAIEKMEINLSLKLDEHSQKVTAGQAQLSRDHEETAAKLVHLEYIRQSFDDLNGHLNKIINIENGHDDDKAA